MLLRLDVALRCERLIDPLIDAHQSASEFAGFDRRCHLFCRSAGHLQILHHHVFDGVSGLLLGRFDDLVSGFDIGVDFD